MVQYSVVDSETSEKYLRIASVSIALYDYIITLPAEWRFYRSQSSILRLSLACVLFILIRYISIVVMIISNYGYFATGFTDETCRNFFLLPPAFKVVQIMISQVILGIRTFNIAKRDKRIGIFLLLLYIVSVALEWFTNLFDRFPASVDGNCTSGNPGKTLSAWLYYLAAMIYDVAMLTISTSHLLRYSPLSNRLGQLIRVLIYDGIGYFLILSGVNIFNLILYHTTDFATQSAGSSLGYAITWIMSQRILIHLREMKDPEKSRLENVVLARPARHAISALRSPFESKSPIDAEFATSAPPIVHPNDMELDIRVCVERTVMVDYNHSEHSSTCGKPVVE
ncbi:hypothetical protein M405DRAFT_826965 [Rhizopogon salebrosus TDB-379]|nr:hypothetical protein M405DRAFT_826965 [Rhizopogon salebrosus TDB-379]